jgi:hypothetical protein
VLTRLAEYRKEEFALPASLLLVDQNNEVSRATITLAGRVHH